MSFAGTRMGATHPNANMTYSDVYRFNGVRAVVLREHSLREQPFVGLRTFPKAGRAPVQVSDLSRTHAQQTHGRPRARARPRWTREQHGEERERDVPEKNAPE